jgi:hypothetical protein
MAPRGSDKVTSTTAGNEAYEKLKPRASTSDPVIEDLLAIGKTFRVQRFGKQLRGVANELAGMNH